MKIPFTKAQAVGNDFLLTRASETQGVDLPGTARAICDRYTGVGADGWMLIEVVDGGGKPVERRPDLRSRPEIEVVEQEPEITRERILQIEEEALRKGRSPEHAHRLRAFLDASPRPDAAIRLFNADGSEPELSGNGTRCAAAYLIDAGLVQGPEMRIATGAGVKHLRLIERQGLEFRFEMNMGRPAYNPAELHLKLPLRGGPIEVTALSVGNPQCVVFVENFELDWRGIGAEIEHHPHFPNRTNVSFVHRVDAHTLDVRFFERGVGETNSSGTGSTGAAAAAILCGIAQSPVRVITPAGPIDLRWDEDIYLTGPAALVAAGEYYGGSRERT